MRRMLDPKEAGGIPRHGYVVFLKGNFYYLTFTNKDYPFVVGEMTNIYDFTSNQDYKELREKGEHPAGGYYASSSMFATLEIGRAHV